MRYTYRWFRNTFKLYDPEEKIIADSQKYWTDPEKLVEGQYTHNRGTGIFKDDNKWLAVGRQSLEIFQEFTRAIEYNKPMQSMVDWGCGGGANAVHFAPLVEKFYGLDISNACLVECARQLEHEGLHNHNMVEIDASNPEKALTDISHPIDLFFCVYVMEVFPSKEYTERILAIANKMLKSGGLAFLQYKYTTPDWKTQPKRWNYSNDPPNMTSYWTDEFWQVCEKHGLMPKVMKLIPYQPLVTDSRYAYVLCVKK
jgi:ubiquinone/menaquinone biosynthesis C-methylase UbiE